MTDVLTLKCGCVIGREATSLPFVLSQPCKTHSARELRDDCALAALPGVIHARVALMQIGAGVTDLNQASIAEEAYEIGDAMLAERAQ